VRILRSHDPARGMVLLYIQKACTAFHEFEPAFRAGALKDDGVEFFRRRLAGRVRQVLVTMQNNGLADIAGAAELAGILRCIDSAAGLAELAALTDKMHQANHQLLDSLEHKP